MSNPKLLILFIIVATLIPGWEIWSTENYILYNEVALLSATALFLAFAFRVLTTLTFSGVWFSSLTGVFIAIIIKLILNIQVETAVNSFTTKDLLIELIACIFTTFLGCTLGSIIKLYQEKHLKYK